MTSKKTNSKGVGPQKIMAHIKSVQQNDKTSKDIIVYNEGTSSDVVPKFQEMPADIATSLFFDDHKEEREVKKRSKVKQRSRQNYQTTNSNSGKSDQIRLALEIFDKIQNAVENDDLSELKTSIQVLYSSFDKTKLLEMLKDQNLMLNTNLIALACAHNRPQILHFLINESDLLNYLPKHAFKLKKAFCDTVSTNNSKMLETLYDYWSGEVHWLAIGNPSVDPISNLKSLTKILLESEKSCRSEYPQMIADVTCLLSFNNFQIHLYSKLKSLTKLNNSKSEIDAIRDVFLITHKCYMEFTNSSHSPNKDFLTLLNGSNFEDNYLSYLIHNIYYRKMDFTIAVIFLDNLHMLKQRLEMPINAYQEIECTLYYYLYSVIEDWKVYLPENRPVYQNTITLNTKGPKNYGQYLRMNVPHDPQQIYNGPVILLERLKFIKVLNSFIETLAVTTTERNPQKDKIPDEEINSLSLLPYMRDDYSLKKILKYINTISKVDFKRDKIRSILIVQRVIHVIGEFIKNSETGETYHLSSTTRAILQAEIPYNIVKTIEDIRNSFSHAKNGKLIKRIDLETNEPEIFENLVTDIYEINKAIIEVIKLYKPILEESRINSGLLLLEDWKNSNDGKSGGSKLENILLNTHYLKKMHVTTLEESILNIPRQLPKYTDVIAQTLAEIENRVNNVQNDELNRIDWHKIKNIFEFLIIEVDLLNLRHFPFTLTENIWPYLLQGVDGNTIENASKLLEFTKKFYHGNKLHIPSDTFLNEKTKLTEIVSNIGNHNIQHHKNSEDISNTDVLNRNEACIENSPNREPNNNLMKRLFKKLINSSDCWKDIMKNQLTAADNIKLREYIAFITTSLGDYWKIALGDLDLKGIASAKRLLDNISEKDTKEMREDQNSPTPENKLNFEQIQLLADKMNRNWFLTTKEISYLLKNINFNCKCTGESSNFCAHFNKIALKIQNNMPLTGTEFNKLKTLNIDDKCRTTVENLVMGYVRDNKMLECLLNRIQHLKYILESSQDENLLVSRYKHDDKFRIVLEMVISDIMNIFKDGRLKELSETTFSKLLSGILLRNVLNHGNPHLEVIGPTLDSNDGPKALISFALKLVNDEEYLKCLMKLYEDDVERHDVFCSKNLSPGHKDLVVNFKKCTEWKAYIKLLPTKKRGG